MQELERERERRWKAEQAVKKLLDQLQELQSKAQDGQDIQDMAMHATTRLKQALTNEREAKARLQDDFHATKEEAASLAQQLEASKQAQNDQQRALKALQDTASKREVEQTQQRIHESKRTQEAQMRAAATHRELELVRNNETMLRGQVQQLQELLANREQEHRTEMEGRFGLDSREMKEAIAREVSRKEEFHRQQLKLQQDEVDALSQKYSELEDEFRMALQIEAQRFKEVQEAFQHTSAEAAQSKQALIAAQRKDEQSSKLLTELSAMVKEQKGRITEMSKSKHEQQVEMKERIQNLEAHVEEAKKRMVQLEMLKQEKKKMESTLLAQESVIEGLRAERKLWSQELAQQGASLAQDRGRLDAKIEALKTENASLQRQLQRELDSLKIKTKMLDDQTETIRKLKEGLMERDEDLKKAREEVLKVQQDFEAQLDAEMTANQDLQERLDRTRDRKEELKEEKTHLEEQLAESRKAHSVLNAKWKEKSNLIGQLEERVRQMKETWETKERKLTEEHDKAVHAQSVAIEKMRSLDDSFRKQLADIEAGHQVALQRLAQEKQKEIDQAHFRVAEVEEELRELLRENQTNKRAMEERVKKLTKAFSDLQQDMA